MKKGENKGENKMENKDQPQAKVFIERAAKLDSEGIKAVCGTDNEYSNYVKKPELGCVSGATNAVPCRKEYMKWNVKKAKNDIMVCCVKEGLCPSCSEKHAQNTPNSNDSENLKGNLPAQSPSKLMVNGETSDEGLLIPGSIPGSDTQSRSQGGGSSIPDKSGEKPAGDDDKKGRAYYERRGFRDDDSCLKDEIRRWYQPLYGNPLPNSGEWTAYDCVSVENLKEFVRRLKEKIISGKVFPRSDLIIEEIDKLAGKFE